MDEQIILLTSKSYTVATGFGGNKSTVKQKTGIIAIVVGQIFVIFIA